MTRDEITTLFARRIAAMNRHDAAELATHHRPDGVVDSPLSGGLASGREAIQRVYEGLFRAFPDVVLEQDELVVDGERAVLVGRLAGTDTGGFMGLPPSHRRFAVAVVLVCELEDGLIARERRIYDFTGLLLQIGVLKTKPA
jgi:steroid delta-isomerase-like uncharacterized protein